MVGRSRPAAVVVDTQLPLIELRKVEKVYRTGKLEYPALRGVDLTIQAGEMVAIVGPSGERQTVVGSGYSELGPWVPASACSAVSRTVSSRAWTRTCAPEPTPKVQ
jgi:ABC-type glutathione transport system ATPase component